MGVRSNFRGGGGQAQKGPPHREKSRQKATPCKKVLYFIVELFIEDTQYL